VVAGSRSAEIFRAHKGEIESIDLLKMELPIYSAREGFFTRASKGMTFGFGSVFNGKRQGFLSKFAKELGRRIKRIFRENSPENIYIFTPGHMKEIIANALSVEARRAVVLTIEGNFVENHPFDLLKIIKTELDAKRPVVASEEAVKLLKKKR